ncbi:type II toxin-antitoxin system HigB family toxin (plasmid) [Deefgea piscis]|uniref:Type II toxin-antitoxin system HigB family toxin n=1 Tax=Deefgea piscis TaxID=2739061 RepID=A0A6M8SW23_9NEIS|nr:type II toxin-antitoxin system HigB family toxin [Deefgea piscis]QKJ68248.1 type II toxin-antitoxin system HigB family toxin [Deefgea piscis]
MQLVNVVALDHFKDLHADARTALDVWRKEVEKANWKTPQDIKNHYRSADFLPKDRVIFNIRGNNYRLIVVVKYQFGMVVVDWVGTHAEYDKKRFV